MRPAMRSTSEDIEPGAWWSLSCPRRSISEDALSKLHKGCFGSGDVKPGRSVTDLDDDEDLE
jgi:hypothetical protein